MRPEFSRSGRMPEETMMSITAWIVSGWAAAGRESGWVKR
jgi:hypothetical protein